MAEKLGDISLNGNHYRVILETYRSRDASDFSPRASTPGGGIIYSEMALYQPLTIEDFNHGYGFWWHTDSAGYESTVGNVDTRHQGFASLFPAPITRTDDTMLAYYGGFANTHNPMFSMAWSSIRDYTLLYNGATWSFIPALAGLYGRYVWNNGTYTFFSATTGRLKKSNSEDLSVWTDTGVNANSGNYAWIMAHDGYVYAGKYGTNQVYFGSAEDLSDLHGDPTDDPNVIRVGTPGRPVTGAISFAGDLFFARYDGLFRMDKDRSAARRVLDYSDQISSANFKSLVNFNGSLVFPISNKLYQWNGTRVSPITPPRISNTFPYTAYKDFRCFNVAGNFLYLIATTDDTNQYNDLLAFDGVGWFRLHRFASEDTHPITNATMLWTPTAGAIYQLFVADHEKIAAIPFDRYPDFPKNYFPTTGQHSLITSRLDAGFRRIQKSSPSVIIEGSNLSEGHRYLKLYYRLNNDTDWTAWGGTDGTTNLINTDGVTELGNPKGTANSTLEYYWIQLRVDFVTDSANQSPILEGITLRLLMRPDTNYGHSFTIVAGEETEYAGARTDDRDPYAIITDLRACRDSKAPVEFIDPFGISRQVYVTSVNELAVEEQLQDMGAHPHIEHQIMINLIETS